MHSPHLQSTFRSLLDIRRAVPEVHALLENASEIGADLFAHLASLRTYVLTWSSLSGSITHRLFAPEDSPGFAQASSTRQCHIQPFDAALLRAGLDHSIGLTAVELSPESAAFVPIFGKDDAHCGILRLVGSRSGIEQIARPLGHMICPPSRDGDDQDDLVALAHLLGRWAGRDFMSTNDPFTPFMRILEAVNSIVERSETTFWARDFDHDTLRQRQICSEGVCRACTEPCIGIQSEDSVIARVARCGVSHIIPDFPDAIADDRYPFLDGWRMGPMEQAALARLGEPASWCVIPVRIDDTVIGVFSLLAAHSSPSFLHAAAFARAAITTFGRAVDKQAVTQSARELNTTALELIDPSRDIPTVEAGVTLVRTIANLVVPYARLKVGVVEGKWGGFRWAGDDVADTDYDMLVGEVNSIVESQAIRLLVHRAHGCAMPCSAFLAIPLPMVRPTVVFLHGPRDLLVGRSLWAALQQLQAVFMVAVSAIEQMVTSEPRLGQARAYQQMWAAIHDLKNRVNTFGPHLQQLSAVGENGTLNDIKREIASFVNQFDITARTFRDECDRQLRSREFRRLEEVPLAMVIENAFAVRSRHAGALRPIGLRMNDSYEGTIRTYAHDLELVFQELFMNVLKHFDRCERAGSIFVQVQQVPSTMIRVSVWDDVPEPGAWERTRRALRPDSEATLRRFIGTMMDRVLGGSISIERDRGTGTVRVVLYIPEKIDVS